MLVNNSRVRNKPDSLGYSKEKYSQSFQSNIFNVDLNKQSSLNENNVGIRVNRIKNTEEFIPKFKAPTAFERKIEQLGGSNKTITIENNRSSSLGAYKSEIVNTKRKLEKYTNAKDRFYASLAETVPFTSDQQINSSNSQKNIYKPGEKITTAYDKKRLNFENKTSKDVLKESLYSTRVFAVNNKKVSA